MSSAFLSAMDASPANARVLGENGMPTLKTTKSAMVDLFFGLVRGADNVTQMFVDARAEAGEDVNSLADLVVLTMQTRACREGKGERKLFYTLLHSVAELGTEVANAAIELLPHYGFFKDLSNIAADKTLPESVRAKAVEVFVDALEADAKALDAAEAAGEPPKTLSLAGKWSPRENGAYDKAVGLASTLAVKMFGGAGAGTSKASAMRKYRKLVSRLNAALSTTEVLMASHRYAEINFAKVSSLCLQRNRKAFLNEAVKGGRLTAAEEETGNRHPTDADRVASRVHLREALTKKAMVNGKALMPHEIAKKCMGPAFSGHGASTLSTAEKDLMDAQWRAMRADVEAQLQKAKEARDAEMADAMAAQADAAAASSGASPLSLDALKKALPKSVDLGKIVPLVDVSGSMSGQPMEVAIGLGILVSELASPAFRHRCLTFESRPNWCDLTDCRTIHEKVSKLQAAPWGGSTDFEAACERILEAARSAKLTPDEIPDMIVFSDMQFDSANRDGDYGYGYGGGRGSGGRGGGWATQFERLQKRFAEVGTEICGTPYAAPRIIFWNLRSSVGFPVAKDCPNTQLLSGFSPSLLKLVLTGGELVAEEEEEVTQPDGTKVVVKRSGPTPEETLRKALDDDAFDAVRMKLSALETGVFASYTFAKEDAGFEIVDVS